MVHGFAQGPVCVGNQRRCGARMLVLLPLAVAVSLLLPSHAGNASAQAPQVGAALSSFEVASIRPSKPSTWGNDLDESENRLTIKNFTVRQLIREAYGLKSDAQIKGGPEWIANQRFDILAKVDDGEVAKMDKMNDDDSDREWRRMLQSLLATRFALKVTREERSLPVYALVVARSGVKIKPTLPNGPNGQAEDGGIDISNGELTAKAATMDGFTDVLTNLRDVRDRVVVNRTNLAGDFDFKLDWARDRGDGASTDSPYPGLFTALPEQLGLKLKSERAQVDVVMVESASEPSMN